MSVIKEEPVMDECLNLSQINRELLTCQTLSNDEKLNVLSILLSVFEAEQLSKTFEEFYIQQENRNSLLLFLKTSLRADQNKYIAYTARKVITSLIKVYKSKDCLELLQECLCSRALDHVCMGLQICKELFSRKNSVHELMVSQLGTSVLAALTALQTGCINSVIYNQCVQEFFSVCIKLAKILSVNKRHKESECVLQQVLKADEVLNRILFQDGVKVYAKRKLIHFICFSMKSCYLMESYPISEDIYCMSVSIFHKLCSCDILKILKRPGQTTFVGSCTSDGDKRDEGTCLDNVHVREWTFLCFCVTAILARKQGYREKAVSFLNRLDDCIEEMMDKHGCSHFSWLPEVYGDQDDMWIDAMLLLMEIFTEEHHGAGSFLMDEFKNQHHLHFLQFVGILGYDHLVLVDLLTSPETNFLTYLSKYLKYFIKTWEGFKLVIVKHWKQMIINGSSDEESVETDVSQEEENDKNVKELFVENVHEEHGITDEKGKSVLADSDVTFSLMVNKDSSDVSRTENMDSKSILAYSSLNMIADAYDNDSGESDDDNGIAVSEEMLNPDISQNFGSRSNHATWGREIEGLDGKLTETDENEVKRKEFTSTPERNFDKCFKKFEENDIPINATDAKFTNQGFVCDKSVDCVLDKVMGMLIRTRMKLEKLSQSGLMKYNPAVLVNLIASVEEMYEGEWSKMCRWGCTTTNTTYMCKWCGTRYCRECLRGDFLGLMNEPTQCRICNQKKCQGNRVEYVPRPKDEVDPKSAKGRASSSSRARSAKSSAKSNRSKSAKSSRAKSGKKSGKKKKKK